MAQNALRDKSFNSYTYFLTEEWEEFKQINKKLIFILTIITYILFFIDRKPKWLLLPLLCLF